MKFGKYLEAEQVPEWEKMYVDYKHLKRRIKEIAAAQERNRKSQRGDEHVSLLKRASTYLGYDSFNLDHHASHTHGESSGVDYRRTPAQGSGYGSCTTKDCTRCQHFSRVVSATPQIAIGMSAGNSGNVSSTPVELAHGANIKIPLSAQDSFTETIRRRRGSVSPRGGGSMSTEAFKKELGVRIEEEQEFFADMEHELAKVNDFFRQKQDLFHSRFDNIIEQQRMLDEMVGEEAEAATLHSPPKGHEQVSGSGSKLRRLTALSSAPDSNLPGPSAPLRAAKSKIKRAMLELYRGIEMLKNYRILCYTAFIKALKKYQKTAKWCDGTDYFLDRVDGCYMATSPDLNMLARELEGMYIERHAGGSRSKGMDTLRINTSGTSRDNQGSTFRSGLLLGTSFPLIIRAIYESNLISNEDRVPYHRELLQIYGGIFLVLLFLLLFSLNMTAWVRAHINYRFIFEVDPRDNLDAWQFLEMSSWFFFIASCVIWTNFALHIDNNSYICLYVLLGLLIGMFVMPVRVFYWSSRRWMLKSLSRIFLSGAYSVEFRDFFLGDEMCSLTYTFSMVLLFSCASANKWTDLGERCNTTQWWSNAAFLMIPNLLRLLQCIRRYVDSGDAFPHLANGAKYSSTILTVWLASAHRIHGGTAWDSMWVVSAIANSCFTSLWDLLMDWGLFESGSKHRFLRSELKFDHVWIYYVAIVMDVILRFAWITQISPTFFSFGHAVHTSTVAYVAAVLEVARRISWNFLRVENEHISNCGQFRATTDIPLPFSRPRGQTTGSDADQMRNEFGSYSVVKVPPATSALHKKTDDDDDDDE